MYEQLISHYFNVCHIIETALADNMEWDTTLDKLEITENDSNNEETLDVKETCARFELTTDQAEAFFIVHCCLSNYLYNLINRTDYLQWMIESESESIKVFFDDGTSKTYGATDINALMSILSTFHDIKWTFDELVSGD